jgi:hypothetical protein
MHGENMAVYYENHVNPISNLSVKNSEFFLESK